MIELNVGVKNNMTPLIKKIQTKLKKLPQEAYKEFVEITPERSGNAKRKTKLHGNKIKADYPYAEVLDKGRHMTNRGMRGSKQAPKGMSKPTKEFMKKRLKQILKGK